MLYSTISRSVMELRTLSKMTNLSVPTISSKLVYVLNPFIHSCKKMCNYRKKLQRKYLQSILLLFFFPSEELLFLFYLTIYDSVQIKNIVISLKTSNIVWFTYLWHITFLLDFLLVLKNKIRFEIGLDLSTQTRNSKEISFTPQI